MVTGNQALYTRSYDDAVNVCQEIGENIYSKDQYDIDKSNGRNLECCIDSWLLGGEVVYACTDDSFWSEPPSSLNDVWCAGSKGLA